MMENKINIMNITEEVEYRRQNKLCCMCESKFIIILDKKANEYLCRVCNYKNDEAYIKLR